MKILFVQKRLLFPFDTGAKIRTLNVVRHLAKWNDVTFLCNTYRGEEDCLAPMQKLGVRLEAVPSRLVSRYGWGIYQQAVANIFSPTPFNVARNTDKPLKARVRKLVQAEAFDLLICDMLAIAKNVSGIDGPRRLLFQHNVEAEIFDRHVEMASNPIKRTYMKLQRRRMRRFEAKTGFEFDGIIAVSQRDREHFERKYGWNHVEAIDTAVDTEYFHPTDEPEQADRVLFVGSLDWMPNQDGVADFVHQTWPLIRNARPSARFQIVGRHPSAAVQHLACEPGVEVVGTVPDVRPYLQKAAVIVVPLRVGGGTRIKIFEALSMQKAVVSTSLGAEGLPVTSGEHLLLEDQTSEFARVVVDLLERPQRRSELGMEGRRLVVENFSAEPVARRFQEICEQVATPKEPFMAGFPICCLTSQRPENKGLKNGGCRPPAFEAQPSLSEIFKVIRP